LAFCCARPETFGRVYDVGGPDVITYEDMVRVTAQVMGRSRRLFPFAWFTTRLSCLWVSLVTGAPRVLVRPLVESLNHETVARNRALQELAAIPGRPFEESVRTALNKESREPPRAFGRSPRTSTKVAHSVERHVLPPGWDAERVAQEYLSWLVTFLPFLRAK